MAQKELMQSEISCYIEKAAKFYRPDKTFEYDKNSENFVAIFKAMREHIKDAPFKQKVINFFRRF